MKKLSYIALGLCIQSSFAGGMGSEVAYPTFDGFYAGLGSGFSTLFSQNTVIFPSNPTSTTSSSSNQVRMTETAVMFDGHVGYGRTIRPNVYLGVKGSVDYIPLEQAENYAYNQSSGPILLNGNTTNTVSIKPIYNINGVLGYEGYQNWLPFVEAGVSFSSELTRENIKLTKTNLSTNTIINQSSLQSADGYKTGYNVGLGSRYKVDEHWMVSAELLYNSLSKYNTTHTLGLANPTIARNYQLVSLFGSVSYLI